MPLFSALVIPADRSPMRPAPVSWKLDGIMITLVAMSPTTGSTIDLGARRGLSEQASTGKVVGGEAFETDAVGPVTLRHDASGAVEIIDGPFAGDSETLGGFILIEAADLNEAVEIAKSWPTGETIEVRPIWVAS
jgi:hypothetical protein